MSNEEVAAWLKLLMKASDELFLSRGIEVNHHVTAQNEWELCV